MLWHKEAIFEPKGDMLASSTECRIARWQTDWALEDQAKTRTRQPFHMIS